MKRQRYNDDMSGAYGYGSYDLQNQAAGPGLQAVDSGSAMPMHSRKFEGTSLQYGMQPNAQANFGSGLGGLPQVQGDGLFSNPSSSMNSNCPASNHGGHGMGMSAQLGQGMGSSLGSGMAANMGQSQLQSIGQNMGHTTRQNMGSKMGNNMASDIDPTIFQSTSSGFGQNFSQNMGSNLSVGPNVGNMGMGPKSGLTQSFGQGMGISEGFPCVKLRGLPFDANEQDIAAWLDTEPLDIIIVRKAQRSTGEAFILLRMPVQVDLVLRKNKSYIGRRYIEVTLAKKLDFYRAVHAMVQDDMESKSSHQEPSPVAYDRRQRADHRGEQRHAQPSSPPRRRHSSRHSSRDMSVSKHRHAQGSHSHDNDHEDYLLPSQKIHTGVLKMRGLPFAATPEDVVYWFNSAGLPIGPITSRSVHIVISSGGKPTGNGYVRFGSIEESKAAMAKDRKSLGSRYIELFPCKPEEMPE